jgi:hypothetical protein
MDKSRENAMRASRESVDRAGTQLRGKQSNVRGGLSAALYVSESRRPKIESDVRLVFAEMGSQSRGVLSGTLRDDGDRVRLGRVRTAREVRPQSHRLSSRPPSGR